MRFKDHDLEAFFDNPVQNVPEGCPHDVLGALYRRLQMLDAACSLGDLHIPPGNRLEKLKGDRAGQYSIRVNEQWRLCFVWSDAEAVEVEFCDYH